MQDNFAHRKEERKILHASDKVLSLREYNLAIGLVILWGVLWNVAIVKYLTPFILGLNPILFFVGYLVCLLAGVIVSWKSKNPWVSFAGYNLVVLPLGALLAVSVNGVATQTIYEALLLTGIITALMVLLASALPSLFAKLGKVLFVSLLAVVVGDIICLIIGIEITLLTVFAAGVFALYIGYDWYRAQVNVPTLDNAIDSALDIYMDIVLLFVKILRLAKQND